MAERTKRQALLVDLDGTLYRGDGPVRCYAESVADTMSISDAVLFMTLLDGYLTVGPKVDREPELLAATDGWEAVQRLAVGRFGVSPDVLDAAFRASRRALAGAECVVEVPVGLLAMLRRIGNHTRLVLATNSPEIGLLELLDRLGARDVFDEVIFGAGKPAGLPRLLAGLARQVGATESPWRLFSVGDHWHNDIEPAVAFGASTGYIDRFGRADGAADVSAPTMEELLPEIEKWAANPDVFDPRGPKALRTRSG